MADLGSPFTHQRQPLMGVYVGAITPANNPDQFLASLSQLIHYYKSNLANIPLIVNTSGWIKGMGYDLLLHFLNELSPTLIVQIQSKSDDMQSKNLPQNMQHHLSMAEDSLTVRFAEPSVDPNLSKFAINNLGLNLMHLSSEP